MPQGYSVQRKKGACHTATMKSDAGKKRGMSQGQTRKSGGKKDNLQKKEGRCEIGSNFKLNSEI